MTVLAVPLSCQEGRSLVKEDGSDWQIEPCMPGAADFKASPQAARLTNAMSSLAQFHRVAAIYRPDASSAEWFSAVPSSVSPAVETRLRAFRWWDRDRLRELSRRIEANSDSPLRTLARHLVAEFSRASLRVHSELSDLRDQRYRLQVCLRDVWHDHLLFTGDAVTGLIDPSASRTENVAADLARLIGSLVGDDRSLWDRAMDAYCRAAPLTASEIRLVAALDRSGVLLSPMTWLERFFFDHRPVPSDTKLHARLGEFAARMERIE